jgi:hypothetical protein
MGEAVVGLWMSNFCQEIMSPGPSLFKRFLRQRNVFSLRSREGHQCFDIQAVGPPGVS